MRIEIGIADPYTFRQSLVTPFGINGATGLPYLPSEFWRNAFVSVRSVTDPVMHLRANYSLKDNVGVGLGLGWRGRYGNEIYSTSYTRAEGLIARDIPLSFSKELVIVAGACFSWDHRWHKEEGLYSNSRYSTISTNTYLATIHLGLRLGGKQLSLTFEAGATGVAFVTGRYDQTGYGNEGLPDGLDFNRLVGPAGLLRSGLTLGPVSLRLGLSF
ncbi:MAG: hypothetical protein IPL52_05240 [Flavobacteriales bacterium]|nr:hypothetical protein [Flavobacteriales bacterium]